MSVRILRNNFTAGELSPHAESRGDLRAVHNGCREMTNAVVVPYGGAAMRPGTDFKALGKYSDRVVRLVEFIYSTVQTYAIEFGHRYLRFYANGGQVVSGGVPYEIATTYNEADLAGLQWEQSADVLFIVHGSYPPRRLKRLGHTNWVLEDVPFVWPAFQPETDSDEAANIKASAVTGSSVTLTADKDVFIAALHVGAAIQLRELPRGNHEAWEVERRHKNGGGDWWPYTDGQFITYEGRVYEIMSVQDQGQSGSKPPVHESGTVGDGNPDDNQAGNLMLRFVNYGKGWARITSVTNARSAKATVMVELPGICVGTGTRMWSLGAWGPGGYPAAQPALHQGRMALSGSALSPDQVYGSAVEGWLTYRLGTLDDESFQAPVRGSGVQAVRFMISAGARMIVGTEAGVWTLSPGPNKAYLAPSSIISSFDVRLGCAAGVPARRANHETIMVHRSRRRVHALRWALDTEGMQESELTIMAQHMFAGGIREWAYQEGATPTIWIVLDNGELAVCTYMPEQEIVGWYRHRTDGHVLSVAVLPSPGGDDEVWVAVRRYREADGVQQSHVCIERYRQPYREGTEIEDSAHLDSCLTYEGVPADEFSQLGHLAGRTVSILADGRVMQDQVVSAQGTVTLPAEYSKVTIGLPYRMTVEPTDPDVGAQDGSTRGRRKRTISVALDLWQSGDCSIGPRGAEALRSEMEPHPATFDVPVPLTTGMRRSAFAGGWDYENSVVVIHDSPLPFMMRSLSQEYEIGSR